MSKKEKETEEKERYLISYADLMTLLVAFLMIMLALSEDSPVPIEDTTKELLFQGAIVLFVVVPLIFILFKFLLMLKKKQTKK